MLTVPPLQIRSGTENFESDAITEIQLSRAPTSDYFVETPREQFEPFEPSARPYDFS